MGNKLFVKKSDQIMKIEKEESDSSVASVVPKSKPKAKSAPRRVGRKAKAVKKIKKRGGKRGKKKRSGTKKNGSCSNPVSMSFHIIGNILHLLGPLIKNLRVFQHLKVLLNKVFNLILVDILQIPNLIKINLSLCGSG